MRRCSQLAAALQALRPDLYFEVDRRLREMDFGAWEGQAWNAIPRIELDAWTADFGGYQTGGHGESTSGFLQRVGSAFDEVNARANGNDLLWITHAGVIRAATLIAAGQRTLRNAGQWPAAAPGFGQWHLIEMPKEVHNHKLPADT